GASRALAASLRARGGRPGHAQPAAHPYHIMPAGLRPHRAFEEAGCLVLNGGTGNSRLQVELAQAWRATVYAGTPSFLANLGDTAREIGLDPRRDLAYRVGFSTAVALTPSLRRDLEETFGSYLFDHCGEAQIGPLAGECGAHDGMHLHALDLFCEFLDPETGEPVSEGGTGELIATQLGPRALPLVRYAPGDVFRLLPGACGCGDPAPRVVFVGQVGAIRKIKGVLVHPSQVHRALSEFPAVSRFQIVVDHPAGERYDRAVLRAGLTAAADDPERLARAIAERVKAVALVGMDVELVLESELPEGAAAPRFAETIVDRRSTGGRRGLPRIAGTTTRRSRPCRSNGCGRCRPSGCRGSSTACGRRPCRSSGASSRRRVCGAPICAGSTTSPPSRPRSRPSCGGARRSTPRSGTIAARRRAPPCGSAPRPAPPA